MSGSLSQHLGCGGEEVSQIVVHVEFYGIPRHRAGVACLDLELSAPACLADLFARLEVLLPDFGRSCLKNGNLRDGFIANVSGERFVRDLDTMVGDGDSVLILSADAGG